MIHPTAVIEPGAQLGSEVRVGPYAVIGPHVVLANNVDVGAHAVIEGHTSIGAGSVISSFSAIGQPPQDIHYHDEPTRVEIGQHCAIREFVSIHRGTANGGGITRVGDHCMIMAYSHVAHDCQVGNHVIMANGATLAGHVQLHDNCVIGGLTAIHQFARVGCYSFIGGASAISMDVVPYVSAAGNRASVSGVNVVGLSRKGFSDERIKAIREAYRLIFRANLRLEQAREEIDRMAADNPDIQVLQSFLHSSKRGICR